MQSSPPPLPAILSLLIGIALEWQAAPLALGSFSPAIAWAIALTGIPHLPLSWILVCLVCAIWARSVLCGYGWKDAALDIVPAALGVLVVSRLDLFSAVFCLLAIAFPLPWALSHGWGRSHDVKNMFIVDGSVFVTSGGVNPTSTIQAIALYVADQIKQRLANLFD